MTSNGSGRVRFGPYEVDLHTHELWKYGTKLKLIGQPFEILAVLLSRPGELVTREELRARLWPGDTFVDFNHGLNAAVNKLRDVLSDSAEEPRYVETLPRRGYRFIAKIERTAAAPAANAAATPQIQSSVPSEAPPESVVPAPPTLVIESHGKRLWTGFLATTVVLAVLAGGIRIFVKRDEAGAGGSATDFKRTRPLTSVAENTGDPAFSADGNSIAFVRDVPEAGQSGVFVKDTDDDRLLQLTHDEHDCCPVWSPDGRSIAFSRYEDKQLAIYVVPADAGAQRKTEAQKQVKTASAADVLAPAPRSDERKLNTNGLNLQRGELDWSPDGKSIAFSAGPISLLSLEGSVIRRLTDPPSDSRDWGPKFSADGQKVLFVREHEIGLPAEILITDATGRGAVRVVSEPGQIIGSPQWSPDERSVIYASDRGGHPALWRVALDKPDSPVQVGVIGEPTWSPVVSRRGYRLAYQRQTRSLGIWQMDISNSNQKPPRILVPWTSNTDQGPGPQFSPDGKKLAYMSDRSGTMEIWVSNRDGSDAFQLTNVGGAGTPRWSPDSQFIVFDTRRNERGGIVTIKAQGGAPHVLVEDPYANVCPSWSRDGKWVYFASARSDRFEVWKVPAEGGSPVQVTHQGGHAALESFDGKYVYYAKSEKAEPEVWRVPVRGGPEVPVPLVQPGTWASWQIVNGGILFVGPSLGHEAVLSSYDFVTRRATTLAVLHLVPFWLGAASDGKTIAFDQLSREQSQIMLVENFR